MKFTTKIVTVLFALGLATVLTFVTVTLAVAQPSEVWVDDDYCNSCLNDGHTWDYDAFDKIQDGIDAVTSPGTVRVATGNYTPIRPGEYQGNILFSGKNDIALIGSGASVTKIQGDHSTCALWVVDSSNIQVKGFTITNGGQLRHDEGGGLHVIRSTLTIEVCVITDNEAVNGGAIAVENGVLKIINSLLFNNRAENGGGAMLIRNGSEVLIETTTVVNNIASFRAGGIINEEQLIVRNSIFWNNNLDQIYTWPFDAATYVSFSDIQGGHEGESNIDQDPLFVDEVLDNFRLNFGSPAVDAGTNTDAPSIDLDGRIRPIDGNGDGIPIVDMGAYEFVQPYFEVEIDIKPGSYPNSINLKSKGKVPVAVLTTDDFDAYDVDPDTCVFANANPLRWKMEDVDNDGDHDMLLHCKTQELDLTKESTEATLEGETYEGIQIIGTDSVNIVPKGKGNGKKGK